MGGASEPPLAGAPASPAPTLSSHLGEFSLSRVLSCDAEAKRTYLLGSVGGARAVLKLERTPLAGEATLASVLSAGSAVELSFSNDVYSKYAVPSAALVADLVCPAADKHVAKYEYRPGTVVEETAAAYQSVVRPVVEATPASRVQWVYNILDKVAEAERLVAEDLDPEVGFCLHPDLKWDGADASNLYCLALLRRRDVRSLRDLTAAHLPTLRNVLDKGCAAVEATYGVPRHKLRVFMHYQPSYYHAHVHFVHCDAPSAGQAAGKAHLLQDVIAAIEVAGDFFQKATLTYVLPEGDEILARMRAAGHAGGGVE